MSDIVTGVDNLINEIELTQQEQEAIFGLQEALVECIAVMEAPDGHLQYISSHRTQEGETSVVLSYTADLRDTMQFTYDIGWNIDHIFYEKNGRHIEIVFQGQTQVRCYEEESVHQRINPEVEQYDRAKTLQQIAEDIREFKNRNSIYGFGLSPYHLIVASSQLEILDQSNLTAVQKDIICKILTGEVDIDNFPRNCDTNIIIHFLGKTAEEFTHINISMPSGTLILSVSSLEIFKGSFAFERKTSDLEGAFIIFDE